jgi:hypothetical protein
LTSIGSVFNRLRKKENIKKMSYPQATPIIHSPVNPVPVYQISGAPAYPAITSIEIIPGTPNDATKNIHSNTNMNSGGSKSTKGSAMNVSKGIRTICNRLNELDITYSLEVKFRMCRDQRELPFDISVIIKGRLGIIEYDGKQHFEPCAFGGSSNGVDLQEKLNTQKSHDIIKNKFTQTNEISLCRISYQEDSSIIDHLDKFLTLMRASAVRVEYFSNPTLYSNPYGKPLEEGGCQIM